MGAARSCSGLGRILVVQDTSTISFSGRPGTAGLGPVNDLAGARGIFVHSTLALHENGRPLGLLHQHMWTRDPHNRGTAAHRRKRKIKDKESFKWLDGIEHAHERLEQQTSADHRPRMIHIMDREGDIHEVLQAIIARGQGCIIRCNADRCVGDPSGYAHASVRAQPPLGVSEVDVPRTHDRPARRASVEVRSCRMNIKSPRSGRKPVELTLLEIWEPQPPQGDEPLHWLLWTTEPADTLEAALQVATYYTYRWRIEDMHLVLKSGCGVEKLQLETAERLMKALAVYSSVAVRIVALRDSARKNPDALCTEVMEPTEWRALWTVINKQAPEPEQQPPTLRQAVLWIGQLGGHLNRKQDGMPGVKTLWRGWLQLQTAVEMFVILRPSG